MIINTLALEDFWSILYSELLLVLKLIQKLVSMFQTDVYQLLVSMYKVHNVAPSKG